MTYSTRASLLPALVLALVSTAQPPIPPPVGTNLNSGIPAEWTMETLSGVGFTWNATVGYGGSGGLIMDCGGCSGYQESTIWSPWLTLCDASPIDLTFKCAIIGGGMMVPPPIFIRYDDGTGPYYAYRYGFADLIPPPDEVIPSTIDPAPPLDASAVEWVPLTWTIFAGLNCDSVRIGLASGIPLGGWALLDDIFIGDINTGMAEPNTTRVSVAQDADAISLHSASAIASVELLDATGRLITSAPGHGQRMMNMSLNGAGKAIYLMRVRTDDGTTVIRIVH
ncbi:MAG: T9SS type A sorting domain-containing protein [Flavobacteriales bacterium]